MSGPSTDAPQPTATDALLAAADDNAERFDPADPGYDLSSGRPRSGVAVVTCMDARIDPVAAFDLEPGDAHVIRNGGGLVTDDVLRSLTLSQRALGTREVMIVQHTRCGLLGLVDATLLAEIEASAGVRPPFALGGFADLDASVLTSVERRAAAASRRASPAA